jgi:Family of unknown function (DUF5335)
VNTREIPRGEWQHFCDDFSRKHRGEKVTVDVLDRDLGAQREIEHQPFVGISADEKSGENVIEVMVGEQPDRNAERIINNPAHLRVAEGGKPALEIEPRDGPTTIVMFEE